MSRYSNVGKAFATSLLTYGLVENETQAKEASLAFQSECGQRSFEVKTLKFGKLTKDGKASSFNEALVPKKNETMTPALSLQFVFQALAELPDGFVPNLPKVPENVSEWLRRVTKENVKETVQG